MTEQHSPTWSAFWAERFLQWFHQLPHLNFKFKPTHESFTMDLNSQYAQSLVLFCALSLAVALLLLLIIVVVWICQCCRRRSDNVHSRRHIRRLSTALFLLSVICFALLGCCLYGNEHVNKSVNSAITGLRDFSQQLRASLDTVQRLNSTQASTASRLEELATLIEKKSKGHPEMNQTVLREVDALLTEVTDKVDEVKQQLAKFSDVQPPTRFLERSVRYGSRIEFERWLLAVYLG
jgi:Tweety